MIKCDDRTVSIRGFAPDIKTEFTIIVKHLVESGALDDHDIDDAVRMAKMSSEELEDELYGEVKDFLGGDKLSELLKLFEKKLKSEEDPS